MGKYIPKRCPNCGSTNIHNKELESGSDTSELYDTYCRDCEWSGDISPDIPLSHQKTQKGKNRPMKATKTLEEITFTLKTLKPSISKRF